MSATEDEPATAETYEEAVSSMREANPRWRLGQTYFNVLYFGFPELADRIRGSNLDPFHSDDRIPAFRAAVYAEMGWGEPT